MRLDAGRHDRLSGQPWLIKLIEMLQRAPVLIPFLHAVFGRSCMTYLMASVRRFAKMEIFANKDFTPLSRTAIL